MSICVVTDARTETRRSVTGTDETRAKRISRTVSTRNACTGWSKLSTTTISSVVSFLRVRCGGRVILRYARAVILLRGENYWDNVVRKQDLEGVEYPSAGISCGVFSWRTCWFESNANDERVIENRISRLSPVNDIAAGMSAGRRKKKRRSFPRRQNRKKKKCDRFWCEYFTNFRGSSVGSGRAQPPRPAPVRANVFTYPTHDRSNDKNRIVFLRIQTKYYETVSSWKK